MTSSLADKVIFALFAVAVGSTLDVICGAILSIFSTAGRFISVSVPLIALHTSVSPGVFFEYVRVIWLSSLYMSGVSVGASLRLISVITLLNLSCAVTFLLVISLSAFADHVISQSAFFSSISVISTLIAVFVSSPFYLYVQFMFTVPFSFAVKYQQPRYSPSLS